MAKYGICTPHFSGKFFFLWDQKTILPPNSGAQARLWSPGRGWAAEEAWADELERVCGLRRPQGELEEW